MKRRQLTKLTATTFVLIISTVGVFLTNKTLTIEKTAAANGAAIESEIEAALFTRTEFFGANAIVPFPTAEARERLLKLDEKYPNDAQIQLRLSQTNERLNDYKQAEQNLIRFVELNNQNAASLEELTAFYERRAEFERAAATLERLLKVVPAENRAAIFQRLIESARVHRLEKYLDARFYEQFANENHECFEIIANYIDKLKTEKNYQKALDVLHDCQNRFPTRRAELLAKEIEILIGQNKTDEAETIYHRAFDAFWSEEETGKYYEFLSEHDRLRAYGKELRRRFDRNPADFDAAVRLFHFEIYDSYDDSAASNIFVRVERARRAQKVEWQPEELLTAARLLANANDGDAASRYLYTLFRRKNLPESGELRGKILYRLFEILSDAGDERIALTSGSLDFYRDVARSDLHPGIATGVLSLVFANADAARELADKEATANRLFNRDAARRIFDVYKTENRLAPELAQMYLDLTRLYLASKDYARANQILQEFEQRQEFAANSDLPDDYARVALKLADAFVETKQFDKEIAVYRRVLDFAGKKQTAAKQALIKVSNDSDPTTTRPTLVDYVGTTNQGINTSGASARRANDYYDETQSNYTDSLTSNDDEPDYREILNRLVAALARARKSAEILDLYETEIQKYPDEAGLYEQKLQWLGQTNLTAEQLAVYKTALQKFGGESWRNRLARWFLRYKRRDEFEQFSRETIEKLNDAETRDYLAKFVDDRVTAAPSSFDARLYLSLYESARRRFPHNINFVKGLLRFYSAHEQPREWQNLVAEYYFESPEIREMFLQQLAAQNKLREFQAAATEKCRASESFETLPYQQFRADAAARLSNFEDAVAIYRKLNELYPNNAGYAEKLVTLARSLGQINPKLLSEAANVAHARATFAPASAEARTRAGEIWAENGDYASAREEWRKISETASGDAETRRAAATVFWDYFQYDDALEQIEKLRVETDDANVYAFEAAAIFEAKNDLKSAVSEYVKALDGATPDHENVASSDRAKRRLQQLYARPNLPAQIATAFSQERARRKNPENLVLGYADFLRAARVWEKAAPILQSEIVKSDSEDFLIEARELCRTAKDDRIRRFALARLARTAKNKRTAIEYNFELAEDLIDANDKSAASRVLSDLVAKFPTNYAVLIKADNFFRQNGERAQAIRVLQAAQTRARGEYKLEFGRRLAARLAANNETLAAQTVLENLRRENKLDYGVFKDLTDIYVRAKKRRELEAMFDETIREIKSQNVYFRDINDQVAELRAEIIAAFTKLGDYDAAIRQHIEIINREPENEETVEAALDYAKRRGGAEILLDYYKQTAQTAFKNYRWFWVLARIYESKNDFANAAENYRAAINNQPETIELYDALAAVYERQNDLARAIETYEKTLELTNDEPVRVRRFVKLLEKAGRAEDANIQRQKLPAEQKPQLTLAEEFAAAATLKNTEKAQAIILYRNAFAALAANPLDHPIQTSEIAAYAQTLRAEEDLDKIWQRLWDLREKVRRETEDKHLNDFAKARAQLAVLDNAIVVAIGDAAGDFATETERAALRQSLENVLAQNDFKSNETLALVQNLSRRANFDRIEERILIENANNARALENPTVFRDRFNALADFYRERGDFARVLNLLETERARADGGKEKFDYLPQIIEHARLLNLEDKELGALRERFARGCKDCFRAEPDALVNRYFEILWTRGDAGKRELREIAERSTAFQLQTINFLLEKGDAELAHAAIESANLPAKWKLARHAETAFALAEQTENAERFVAALRLAPIGKLIEQEPAPEKYLAGDEWFDLTAIYGKFLRRAQKPDAEKYLPARIENRPNDANAQTALGVYYLEQKDAARALEHLRLALDQNPNDKQTLAAFGAAQFLAGEPQKADETWARIIAGDSIEFDDFALYLDALAKHDRAATARDRLAKIVAKQFDAFDEDSAENIYSESRRAEFETLAREIRLLAESFGDYQNNLQIAAEEAAYFRKIAASIKENALLPELLIEKSLIAFAERQPLYEIHVARADSSGGEDYDYKNLLKNAVDERAAETELDAANNFEIEQPSSAKINRQKEYLRFLLDQKRASDAAKLTAEVERSLAKRFARPAWLRLAQLEIALLENKSAAETMLEFRRFVGVFDANETEQIAAPNLERLNDAVNLLRAMNQERAAEDLQTAFYARLLALEHFDLANFAALAEIALRRGDAALAAKILRAMTDLSDDEKRETAAAELAEIELIKSFAVDATKVAEDAAPQNSLAAPNALQTAAEIAARFGQFDAAIEFRQRLRVLQPDDATNSIELARLFAAAKRFDEAAKILSETAQNREVARIARWQVVSVAAEIFGDNADLWREFKNAAQNLNANDRELWLGINALELDRTNRVDEAREFLKADDAEAHGAFLHFIRASLAKKQNDSEAALAEFGAALETERNADFMSVFGFAEAEPDSQIINLLAQTNRPQAALQFAAENPNWNKAANAAAANNQFELLSERAARRRFETRLELLAVLRDAAEKAKDFARAAEFETQRRDLLDDDAERFAAQTRVNLLRAREIERNRVATTFKVDRGNLSIAE